MNPPNSLLTITAIAAAGVLGMAPSALPLPDRGAAPERPRIETRQAHNLQHLLGAPKRTYLVQHGSSLYPQPERPALFSVHPRPESVLFML
ncbi:MAG: hypothetical protein HKN82_00815 [Akkermansiaceae bacterium]|nr:hypothetical protein [Akkermansiaceae bacterium]